MNFRIDIFFTPTLRNYKNIKRNSHAYRYWSLKDSFFSPLMVCQPIYFPKMNIYHPLSFYCHSMHDISDNVGVSLYCGALNAIDNIFLAISHENQWHLDCHWRSRISYLHTDIQKWCCLCTLYEEKLYGPRWYTPHHDLSEFSFKIHLRVLNSLGEMTCFSSDLTAFW
jgi:hypothetical protein